jgi:hypothetical protein
MKSLQQFIGVAVFATLSCAGLRAQNVELRADVPFDFYAGNTLIPAGEYVVDARGPVVWLRGPGGTPVFASNTNRTESLQPRQERLVFNRYGNEYFLSAIWTAFTDGRQLIPTARQKELAKRVNVPVQATVALVSGK